MHVIGSRLLRGVTCTGAVLVASAAFGAAASSAAVTTSNVTSAPAFSYGLDNPPSGSTFNNRTVTGTSNGTTGDQVDIRCEAPGGTDVGLASGVAVNADGSFSTTVDNSTSSFEGDLCRIVAVPGGTDPSDLTPYTGPVVGNGEQETLAANSVVYDYFISQPQATAYDDYDSLGSCGLCDSRLYSSDLTPGTHYLWYDNGGVYSGTYTAGVTEYPYAQIDGVNVYDPTAAYDENHNATGAPSVTFTHTIDPTTGNMLITETDPFVKCTSTASPCPGYSSAGLELDRTIVQSQSGRVVQISDVIRSTDGAAHTYSFAYDEYEENEVNNEFQFPGDSGYKAYAGGTTGALSSSPVQTIYAISDATQAPSVNDPVGAITVSPAPSAARFGCSASVTNCDGFDLVYTGTVPAGGSTTISQDFGIGASQAEVEGYALSNTAALTPAVAITSPAANGSTVSSASLPVSGSVSSNVTSLTVDGHAVTPSSGSWSTTVDLSQGSNTITAVATDAEGASATATRTVTYTPTPPVVTSVKVGKASVKGTKVRVLLTCTVASGSKCKGSIKLTLRERIKRRKHSAVFRIVTVGSARYALIAGRHTVTVGLNGTGRRLLARQKKLSVTATVSLGAKKVGHRTVTVKAATKKKHKK